MHKIDEAPKKVQDDFEPKSNTNYTNTEEKLSPNKQSINWDEFSPQISETQTPYF